MSRYVIAPCRLVALLVAATFASAGCKNPGPAMIPEREPAARSAPGAAGGTAARAAVNVSRKIYPADSARRL